MKDSLCIISIDDLDIDPKWKLDNRHAKLTVHNNSLIRTS